MPIVFAAVVPHSPLLIRSVAKEHHRFSEVTRNALDIIAGEFYARQVDAIMILTPHGPVLPDSIVMSVAEKLSGRLSEFGDPRVIVQAPGAGALALRAKATFQAAEVPVQLQTFESLDYGSTIPLSFLPTPLPPTLPVHIANQSRATLLRFGQTLSHVCHEQSERLAILASADLVRRTAADLNARPVAIERTLAQIISGVDISQISALPDDPRLCGLNPIITLIATLAPMRAHGTIRSFEVLSRVGQMTATFDLGT